MPNIIQSFRSLNLLRSARAMFTGNRGQNYMRISRSSEQTPRTYAQSQSRSNNRSLRSRKSKAVFVAPGQIRGNSGDEDGANFTKTLMRGKMTEILDAARITSHDTKLEGYEAVKYSGDFFDSFNQEIKNMSNKDLAKLSKSLNNNQMIKFRSGMDLIARKGEGHPLGARAELAYIGRHLNGINGMITAEMSMRNMKTSDALFEKLPQLESLSGDKKTEKKLASFNEHIKSKLIFKSGDVPLALRREIEADSVKLCKESETLFKKNEKGIEGGVALLDPIDKDSGELDVSEIYIADFSRGKRSFDDGNAVKSNVQLGFNQYNRQEISDHMISFCSGGSREHLKHSPEQIATLSSNQARRVQALMTQQFLAPIYDMQATGVLGNPNKEKGKMSQEIMQGPSDYNFTARRVVGGAVEVHIMQRLNTNALVNKNTLNMREIVDGKKSYIQSNLKFVVPRRKSAPPILKEFTYTTHLASKDI